MDDLRGNSQAVMRAAYLNQAINLSVTVLMVPLLLRYLDLNEYVLWSIFTTFGGVTLQLENGIQMVSVREIAREYHAGNPATLEAAIRKARAAYRALSACVLVLLLGTGLLYLKSVSNDKLGNQDAVEWLLFNAAYALNYYFGANNSILLAMAHVARFNNTTSLTRILNFTCTYLLLKAGLSIMGLCLSFALSVLVGALIILRAAKKSLSSYHASPEARIRPLAEFEYANPLSIVKYTVYTLLSFALYRGGLLVAVKIFPKNLVGAYGLTLQANSMLSALALVPLQVWLSRLVKAITSGERHVMLRELGRTVLTANLIFVAGSVVIVVLGNMLLELIGSKVTLAGNVTLFLVSLAYLVELNILLLASFLVSKGNYRFVRVYGTTSLIAIALIMLLAWASKATIIAFIAIPLGFQSLLCLPLILRMTSLELGITPLTFLRRIGAQGC